MAKPYIFENGVLKPYGAPPPPAGPVWKSGRPTVIHAIGDSLTRGQGAESRGGYRKPLWDLLTAAGKSFSTTGANSVPGPGRWSGDGGWRVQDLASAGLRNKTGLAIVDWVRMWPSDVILLHIGTNNIAAQQIPNSVLVARVGSMLDQVYGFAPTTHVFVASPLVQLNPAWGGTAQYDAALTAMVQAKIDSGRPYHLVTGMNSITGAANYSDPIHLSEAGYNLMAQKWADALLAAT